MTKDEELRKKTIDEMTSKIFDYICTACEEDEGNKRMIEVATSFLSSTVDIDQPMKRINAELRHKSIECYILAVNGIEQIKAGNTENIVSEHGKD